MDRIGAGDLRVRPYEPGDRFAVRDVCFRTGYMGEPVDWQWRDEPSFADMFTGYYTDREPESAFVVEVDGRVAGYLLGCVDSARAWNPGAIAGRHVLRRGIAFRPGTARVVWRTLGDAALDLTTPAREAQGPRVLRSPLAGAPAHRSAPRSPPRWRRAAARRGLVRPIARARRLGLPPADDVGERRRDPILQCGRLPPARPSGADSRPPDPARIPDARAGHGDRSRRDGATVTDRPDRPDRPDLSRRAFLAASASFAALVALDACSGGTKGSSARSSTSSSAASTTTTSVPRVAGVRPNPARPRATTCCPRSSTS